MKLKKIIHVAWCCMILISINACLKKDEYDAPNAAIMGSVIDKNTGKPIQTEQTNGIRIQMEETSWGEDYVPTYFWVKQDGTFQNTKVFSGVYTVTPIDGPFLPLSEGTSINVSGVAEVTFEVEPFLNIEIVDMIQTGGNIAVSFKISRSSATFKITDARVFLSNTQYVGNNTFLNNKTGQVLTPAIDLNGIPDETILSSTYTLNVVGMESGRTYYLRIGARTNDNVQRRYNYSEIKQVTVP